MPKTYARLTEEQRYQIYEGVTEKRSHSAIAISINKHHSAVSREVKRNKGLRGYRPKQAHDMASKRQQEKARFCKLTDAVKVHIRNQLSQEWSPEQIHGRAKIEGTPMVCATTIYGYIRQDKASGGLLYQHLRHKKTYKKRTGSKDKRGQIIGRVSIDERPRIVDEKTRLGDWEADTVIGKGHQGVLVTLAERVSKAAPIVRQRATHWWC